MWRSCRADADSVRVVGEVRYSAADIVTEEYPGFPTDMQAQYMALATQAEGAASSPKTSSRTASCTRRNWCAWAPTSKSRDAAPWSGKTPLSGAAVLASDLRASASLVIAALVADGETIIDRVYHIDRGYERIEEKLRGVGAQIRRIGR